MSSSWRRIVLVYSALRLVVFIGCAGVLLLLGFNGFPLLAFAVLLSSIVSFFVLKPQRLQLTEAQLARREAKAAARQEQRARLESS